MCKWGTPRNIQPSSFVLLGHRRSGSTERADYSHPAQGSIHSCLRALLPRASLPPSSLHWPLPQCPACKSLCTKNAPAGCTWLWLICIISKGSLQPEGAQGAGGAAPELCCSRLAVCGLEISFKHQEPHNTAFKTIFKSREGKFKFTEVMEIPVSSTDAHLALQQELCDGPHEQPSSTPCKWCVNYYYILHLSTSQKASV